MKIEVGFEDLAVGNTVINDSDHGIVVQTLNDGEIVTVCWVGNRVVEDYSAETWNEYEFTAFVIV